MKKFLSMMLIAVFLTTTAVYAATAKIGDVINHVLATDIVAYITLILIIENHPWSLVSHSKELIVLTAMY